MLLTAAEFEETVVAVQREPGELHPLAHDRDVAPEVRLGCVENCEYLHFENIFSVHNPSSLHFCTCATFRRVCNRDNRDGHREWDLLIGCPKSRSGK